jgi:hypothetical protein
MGLFTKSKKIQKSENLYKMLEIDASELDAYPTGLEDIMARNIDGFLIRNAMSLDSVEKLLTHYDGLDASEKHEVGNGMIQHPTPFSLIEQLSGNSRDSLIKFHKEAENRWDEFPKLSGVDFVSEMKSIIEKISGKRPVNPPAGADNQGIYNPATYKYLVPGKGEFKAHCGNYFHNEFPFVYEHMKEMSVIEDQMSYFIMLSPSSSGGELTLYDIEWSEAEIRESGDTVLVTHDGKRVDLLDEKKMARKMLKPNPGDMIVFAGGHIWHKVETALGPKPRRTIGGFLTIARDDKAFYIWS